MTGALLNGTVHRLDDDMDKFCSSSRTTGPTTTSDRMSKTASMGMSKSGMAMSYENVVLMTSRETWFSLMCIVSR